MAKKILIVDDEPEIIVLLKRRLKKQGYETLAANNGVRGLAMAKEHAPDLIVLDVMMPELDGFQVCRLLKFDPQYETIKIIMLTARDQQTDMDIGEEVHADAYVTKPFDPEELVKKIEELLA